MEEINQAVPTPENIDKAAQGREFIASQRAEYNRFAFDIVAQYPVSVGSIITALGKQYGIEQDRVDGKSAKLTIKNLQQND
jgi:hypothetical protein